MGTPRRASACPWTRHAPRRRPYQPSALRIKSRTIGLACSPTTSNGKTLGSLLEASRQTQMRDGSRRAFSAGRLPTSMVVVFWCSHLEKLLLLPVSVSATSGSPAPSHIITGCRRGDREEMRGRGGGRAFTSKGKLPGDGEGRVCHHKIRVLRRAQSERDRHGPLLNPKP